MHSWSAICFHLKCRLQVIRRGTTSVLGGDFLKVPMIENSIVIEKPGSATGHLLEFVKTGPVDS